MPLDTVVLAAGQGTRMRSGLPKVLHPIAGKPMLSHVLDAIRQFDDVNIHVVVGHGAEDVKTAIRAEDINWVYQAEQLGTGHAVQQALPFLRDDAVVLVLYGDVPLVNPSSLKQLVLSVNESTIALLTVELPDPSGYGRVVREDEKVARIVEHKDACPDILRIKEVNTGIVAATAEQLKRWLPALKNNNRQHEYYLTDIISMAHQEGIFISTQQASSEAEVMGVNDRYQQATLERLFQLRTAKHLMAQGVTIMDPARFDCRGQLQVGKDVTIDVNAIFEGNVSLGDRVWIGPNCYIREAIIGNDVEIKANSVIDETVIGNGCDIGPFARLRPGTELKDGARIGNFVETKKAKLGKNSKANHLAYIGDADIGDECNVGAGTITCNYDGVNKHQTVLGHGVFIGSNSTLVAPVTIGNEAFVGAGSTITADVPDYNLGVGRGKQRNIENWQRPGKKGKKP